MTAVEYIEAYLKHKEIIIDDKNIPQVLVGVINEAKEIQKEKIIEAYNQGCLDTLKDGMKRGEQYYNETFKNK